MPWGAHALQQILFVILRDLFGNAMDTMAASKLERMPVRGTASKVIDDVEIPGGAAQ